MAGCNYLMLVLVLKILLHQVIFGEEIFVGNSSSVTKASTSAENPSAASDPTVSSISNVPDSTTVTSVATESETTKKPGLSSMTNITASTTVAPRTTGSEASKEPGIASINNITSTTTEAFTNETVATEVPGTPTKPTLATPPPWAEDYASAFPEPPVCGNSEGTFTRVVGGVNANLGDYPWIAVIAYIAESGEGIFFRCGGSLITSQHTLTAAHCIDGLEKRIYFVRLGELDVSTLNETSPVDALVKHRIKHENYNSKDVSNDIGILVFYRRVRFTDFIRPICLPITSELRSMNFENYRPFIAGWGQTSFDGPKATHLQTLQIQVYSLQTCKNAYGPLQFLAIDERLICAGDLGGGKDACYGDSGGPLMQPIWNSTDYTTVFYQIGVVSFGMKCGRPGFPAGYSRVTQFLPWIQRHVLGTEST